LWVRVSQLQRSWEVNLLNGREAQQLNLANSVVKDGHNKRKLRPLKIVKLDFMLNHK
jgi:hypothetical protein